jgi:hypothetical protein
VGKPVGKRPLGRIRHRWENNIKTDLREIEWGGMDWIHLTWDMDQWRAIVNTAMIYQVPWNIAKLLSRWATVSFSSRTLSTELVSSKPWNSVFSSVLHPPGTFYVRTSPLIGLFSMSFLRSGDRASCSCKTTGKIMIYIHEVIFYMLVNF